MEIPAVRKPEISTNTFQVDPYHSAAPRCDAPRPALRLLPHDPFLVADDTPASRSHRTSGARATQLLDQTKSRGNPQLPELFADDDALDRLVKPRKGTCGMLLGPRFGQQGGQMSFGPDQFCRTQDRLFDSNTAKTAQEREQFVTNGISRDRPIVVAPVFPVWLSNGLKERAEFLPATS